MHTLTSRGSSLLAAPIALRNDKRINLLEFYLIFAPQKFVQDLFVS